VSAAIIIGFTSLRSRRRLRFAFQCLLIGYLGLINGDMLSQALLAGWAQYGVPWRSAVGLVALTVAALLLPILSGSNLYCAHVCPHGAAQQLLRNRLRWRYHVPQRLGRLLITIPYVLLFWCVLVTMASLTFSLVDIEPFDAWVFRVAGWPTITIAVVGLFASLFVPMAYCRYGCPTGTMLNYLRRHARSGEWTRRDWAALALVAWALCCLRA
jgi:polyferredoxin